MIFKAVRTRYNAANYRINASDCDGNRAWIPYEDGTKEDAHLRAARKLIEKRWRNSPEALHYSIHGGWMGPGEYVWVLVDNRIPDLPINWDDCTQEQLEWLATHARDPQWQKSARDCLADLAERGKL